MINKDTLHGTEFNTNGWTEGARMYKNTKRMLSTFEEKAVSNTRTKKVKVLCSECGKRFSLSPKATNIPFHNKILRKLVFNHLIKRDEWHEETVGCNGYLIKEGSEKLEEHTIKGVVLKVGDTIVYESSERYTIEKDKRVLKEKTIQSIVEKTEIGFYSNHKKELTIKFTDGSKMDGHIYEIIKI